jgi:NAD+ kinase
VSVQRACLVEHPGKERTRVLREEVQHFLEQGGVEITDSDPDLVVSLGGDGTMLRAAQIAHRADAVLLGINLGTLGYLTEVEASDALPALSQVMAGEFSIQPRMMLQCDVSKADGRLTNVGLNEVLVERAARHRLVRLSVAIGGERLASFNADGIIVATPTGSTAYALSAGGPIVSPRAETIVVVPVSPHMIFSRPFVLAPDETVEIELEGEDVSAEVTLDGTLSTPITSGDTATVKRHERPLRLVKLAGPQFLARLRTKLGLPG